MDVGWAAMGFYRLGPGGAKYHGDRPALRVSFVMRTVGPGKVDVGHVQPQGQTGQALYGNLTGT